MNGGGDTGEENASLAESGALLKHITLFPIWLLEICFPVASSVTYSPSKSTSSGLHPRYSAPRSQISYEGTHKS